MSAPYDREPSTLLLVQQFLHEHGYFESLKQLERESGEKYDDSDLAAGGMLEERLQNEMDVRLARFPSEQEQEKQRLHDLLRERGRGDHAQREVRTIDSVHAGNVLSLAFCAGPAVHEVATGSSDKTVRLSDFDSGAALGEIDPHGSAVLSLDYNPVHRHLLLSSAMDGSVAVTDVRTKTVQQKVRPHSKYVVCARWHPNGLLFASASHDHTVALHSTTDIAQPFALLYKFEFRSNAESLAFAPDGRLVVGLRENNYLQLIDVNTFEVTPFNMNAALDDHVSFSPLCLSFGPGEASCYLLVSTDRDRLIVYELASSTPVRNFYGAINDAFSQPRSCWHPSGRYVYSTSQDKKVYCWEVSTQRVVSTMSGHAGTVRDLRSHPSENLIGTCSFDRSVKIWGSQS